MAVDARYRDKDGEISRRHGNALVSRLRTSYGSGFAPGCANDDKLSDVLAKLDERSLYLRTSVSITPHMSLSVAAQGLGIIELCLSCPNPEFHSD